ncbi:unnamed protein product [Clonostachys chloroleuca]|uniref:Uncharacterized protein n=1 Tax=Clonostachys chloroleuca TaxID=1926264 RepID=A0AA35LY24_9HYPO|nr:unnamed protein product [Clonostachys chloroleuca]
MPELKGYRCGCVSFSQNRSVPGVICECGHFACFHMNSANSLSPGKHHDDVELLRQRVQALEQQLISATDGQERLDQTIHRLSQMEEAVERNQEEIRTDFKSSYKHMSAAWSLVEQLQKRLSAFEEKQNLQTVQMERAGKELDDLRNRNLELLETDEMLEERIEQLEQPTSSHHQPTGERRSASPEADIPAPKHSSSPSQQHHSTTDKLKCDTSSQPPIHPVHLDLADAPVPTAIIPSGVWTMHVSVLPSRDQPFPFEKDTAAYKRCLSRGLQRVVPVQGYSAEAITSAISKFFHPILQSNAWEPLEAKVCDARRLEGLPMLRPLEPEINRTTYDMGLIMGRCAVRDGSGRIQSMYVALKRGKLSWNTIRDFPVYMEGLESSWAFDRFLDQDGESDGDVDGEGADVRARRSSMPLVTTSTPSVSLKRSSAEMELGGIASNGSVDGESEAPRAKVARTCLPDALDFKARYESDLVSRY